MSKAEEKTVLVYESKFHSFFNDLTTFGFIMLLGYVQHVYLWDSFFIDFTLGFILFSFIVSKTLAMTGILKRVYSKELVNAMKSIEND